MLKLPAMGMPPREPTKEMIEQARNKTDFDPGDWFSDASVVKATDWFDPKCITIGSGETVTITISPAYDFEMAEAEEDTERVGPQKDPRHWKYDKENLYFIQLMPNELPSYVLLVNRAVRKCPVTIKGKTTDFPREGLISPGQNVGTLELDAKGRLPEDQIAVLEEMEQQSLIQRLRARSRSGSVEDSFPNSKDKKPHKISTEGNGRWGSVHMRRRITKTRVKSMTREKKIVPRFDRGKAPKLAQIRWT